MRFTFLISIVFVAGCAFTYKQPVTVAVEASKEIVASQADIFRAAKQILVSEGFQITNSDESAGVISTAPRNFSITPEHVNAGQNPQKNAGNSQIRSSEVIFQVGKCVGLFG
ncbi:MAG: hypothetical protein HOP23_07770 [Methylococcaceae bacterium]|nr:hypothetical protein [Methylococcaceae bacterium]